MQDVLESTPVYVVHSFFSVSELSEHYIRTLNQQCDSREQIQARQPCECPKTCVSAKGISPEKSENSRNPGQQIHDNNPI